MKTAELIALWGSLALVFYAYAIYPLVIAVASRFVRDPAESPDLDGARSYAWPKVTLIIAALRAERVIVDRLRNASALNYPADQLEILVGCDGEHDLTALLARSYEDSRVRVIQLGELCGKGAILNACAAQANGGILVFSDVNTMTRPDAVRRVVRHFQDATVGAVCGKLLPIDPTTGRNISGLFWKFESFVKRCEARLGAAPGVNNGLVAIRRMLYLPLSEFATVDDLVAGLRGRHKEGRLVYDDTAIAVEETPPTLEAEFRRRTAIGRAGLRRFARLAASIGQQNGWIAIARPVHRGLRWLCPALLVAAFVSNACLSDDPAYLHLLLLHELFYLSALVALFFATGSRAQRAIHIPAALIAKCVAPLSHVLSSFPGRDRKSARASRGRPAVNQATR